MLGWPYGKQSTPQILAEVSVQAKLGAYVTENVEHDIQQAKSSRVAGNLNGASPKVMSAIRGS
jgi:hypothetical protein